MQPQPTRGPAAQLEQAQQRGQRRRLLALWQGLEAALQRGRVERERPPLELAGVEDVVPAAADERERGGGGGRAWAAALNPDSLGPAGQQGG